MSTPYLQVTAIILKFTCISIASFHNRSECRSGAGIASSSSFFLILFFKNSNLTSSVIFIVFDSFVCTSFIQPVQRIQLKAGPGAASGAGDGEGVAVFVVVLQ